MRKRMILFLHGEKIFLARVAIPEKPKHEKTALVLVRAAFSFSLSVISICLNYS